MSFHKLYQKYSAYKVYNAAYKVTQKLNSTGSLDKWLILLMTQQYLTEFKIKHVWHKIKHCMTWRYKEKKIQLSELLLLSSEVVT